MKFVTKSNYLFFIEIGKKSKKNKGLHCNFVVTQGPLLQLT